MKRFFLLIALLNIASWAMAQNQETISVNGVSFKMVKVEGGSFKMGATPEQGMDNDLVNNNPFSKNKFSVHSVTLSTYYIGETEVTQELWESVMNNNPSYFKGKSLPVENISVFQALQFIEKLSSLTGKKFRLPTEAEWEFAARGGIKSQNTKYAGSNNPEEVGWFLTNSGKKKLKDMMDTFAAQENKCQTHKVKTKKPNELGIYDMSGNVFEWCSDCTEDRYVPYSTNSQVNPNFSKNSSQDANYMIRGNSWIRMPECLADRESQNGKTITNATGIRLVMEYR